MIDLLNTKLYNKFYEDYISGQQAALRHLSVFSLKDIQSHAVDLSRQSDPHRFAKSILIRQNKDLTSAKAKEHLSQLSMPNSVILITGQQLGLFASPVYTIYKLITTLKLTDKLNQQDKERHYIPVFWLETEDHDFQEINHCGLFDQGFQEKMIRYPGKDRGKVSIRHYRLEENINSFLSELRSSLVETEFSASLFNQLENLYSPGISWSQSVRLFLRNLFEPYGLLFFEPGDEEIKTLSGEFFRTLLQNNQEITRRFVATSARLKETGYPLQVKYLTGQTFIHFEDEENERRYLYQDGEDFYFRREKKRYTKNDILNLLIEHPRRLSTTVISRPLLQSWLLPVAAYIAGPGEIAYWAQIADLFSSFSLKMPVVYPRISATLIEPRINRYLQKYHIGPASISRKRKTFIEDYHKNELKKNARDPIKVLYKGLESGGRQLETYLQALDPTLVDAGKKSIERMAQTLENLENRVLRAREQKNSILSGHLQQVHTAFFPDEMPQERYLSPVYFLNKFGPQFFSYLYENLDADRVGHQLIYLPK
jgi:bacillithiol biosynthesis cysteine-adding enzyme BshC